VRELGRQGGGRRLGEAMRRGHLAELFCRLQYAGFASAPIASKPSLPPPPPPWTPPQRKDTPLPPPPPFAPQHKKHKAPHLDTTSHKEYQQQHLQQQQQQPQPQPQPQQPTSHHASRSSERSSHSSGSSSSGPLSGDVPPARSGPHYLSSALHRELGVAGGKGSPSAVFAAFGRYCEMFQPDMADVDACLNALAKCNQDTWQQTSVFADRNEGKQHHLPGLDGSKLLHLLEHLDKALSRALASVQTGGGQDLSRQLASTAWALASLARWQPPLPAEVTALLPGLFARIEDTAGPLIRDWFEPHNLSLLAWALARAGVGAISLFRNIGNAALERIDQLGPKEFANLTWAFATVKLKHDFLGQVSERILAEGSRQSLLLDFGEQDLSTLTWGFATLRLKDEQLLRAVAVQAEAKIHEFSVPGLVCTVWGFATLKVKPSFLPSAIERFQTGKTSDRLEPRGCSMLLWSMATLRHDEKSELFYLHLADRCILPLAQQFHAQDTSNCLWAFATARVQNQAVFQALAGRALRDIGSFTSQALANVAWACSKMRAADVEIADAATIEALRRPLRTWSPQALVTLCWASAEAKIPPVRLLGPVTDEMRSRPNAFNDVDLATLTLVLQADRGWGPEDEKLRRAALLRIAAEASRRVLPRTKHMLKVLEDRNNGDAKSRGV
ncbi:unnamed protein product, partial [Polarella glacialis]